MDDDAELMRSAVTLDIIQRKLGLKSVLSRHHANPKTPPGPAAKHRRRPAVSRHTRKCNVCRHPERDAIEHGFLCWHSPDALAREYGIADHSSIYRHVHATGIFARRRASLRMALEPLIERAACVPATANAVINAVRLFASINDDGQLIKPPTRHIVIVKHDPPLPPESPAPGTRHGNKNSQTKPAASGSLCGSRLQPRYKVLEKMHLPFGGIFAEPDAGRGSSPLHSLLTMRGVCAPQVSPDRRASSSRAQRGTSLRSSNRQTQRIETNLTHRKQTTATRSNRQKIGDSKSGARRGFLPRAAASGIVERRESELG